MATTTVESPDDGRSPLAHCGPTSAGAAAGVAVVALTLAALGVRMSFWNMPMQCDEAAIFLRDCLAPDRPLLNAIAHAPRLDHHGLAAVMNVAAWKLFGWGFPEFRLPTLLFGVAVAPLTWLTFRRRFGLDIAWLAAMAVVCSSFAIRYSIEARGYAHVTAVSLIAVWATWRAVDTQRLRDWLLAGGLTGLAIYAVVIGFYLLASLAMWLIALAVLGLMPWRRALRGVTLLILSTAATATVLHAPMFLRWGFAEREGGVLGAFVARSLLHEFGGLVRQHLWMVSDGIMPTALYGVLLLIGAACLWRRTRAGAALLACLLLGPIPIYLAQGVLPPDRAMTYLLPFAAVVMAAGLSGIATFVLRRMPAIDASRVRRAAPVAVLSCAMVLFAAGTYAQRYPYPAIRTTVMEDLEPIARYIHDHHPPATPVYAQESMVGPLRYYIHTFGGDISRVRYPDGTGRDALLVYRTRAGITADMTQQLESFERGPAVFASDGVRVVTLNAAAAHVSQTTRDDATTAGNVVPHIVVAGGDEDG